MLPFSFQIFQPVFFCFFFPQALWLCKRLDAIRISQETLLFKEALALTEEAKAYKERKEVCKWIEQW